MRSLLFTHIENARQSLKSNRLRSTLTMFGVMIGVASITTILTLSTGASKIVGDQVDQLGGNIAVIRPGTVSDTPLEDLAQFPARQNFAASTLTENDFATILALPHVQAVAPLMVLTGGVKADSNAPSNTPIVATTSSFETISGLKVREGQFLDPELNPNTTVIGPQLSIDVFGTEESIGKTIQLRGTPFTVIGVLKRENNPINYNGVDLDASAIIGIESGRLMNNGSLQIQQINVRSDSVDNLSQLIIDINKAILKNHASVADFSVLSGDQIAQPTNRLFYAIAGTTTAVAAISLLVGGIGIMNIMLVSVAERTREIGIRKALGATNSDIVWQFLIESLALSIGGGIIGYLSGYLLAFGISTFLTFDPVLNWQIAAVALGVSVVIGTVFGIYPAIRASRKDPISALRQYD
ncbi:MAG: putative Efflux transporter, permease protein [Candidatus Saccharibacteria bacterium]|nr:putative Efflux transporter, permease protein [Candidatus Saccharibacteria bacterium]